MPGNKKIIIGIILTAAAGGFVFWTGKIIRERYFLPEGGTQQTQTKETQNAPENNSSETTESSISSEEPDTPGEFLTPEDKKEDEEEDKELKEDQSEPTLKENFIDIKKKDCDENCQDFKDKSEDYKYCREVCGLDEVQKRSSEEECEDKEDLELDYCLRDLGIAKKSYAICEKIEDSGIEKMCRDRITEELLDGNSAE